MAAFLLLAVSGQTQQCATTQPSFAKLFTYEDMGSYQNCLLYTSPSPRDS